MITLTRQGSTALILGPAVNASAISRDYGTAPEPHVIVKITEAKGHHKVGDVLVWPVAEPRVGAGYKPSASSASYVPRGAPRR